MFSLLLRRLHLRVSNRNVATIASPTEVGFSQNSAVRLISSSLNAKKRSFTPAKQKENAERHSFTVSYLVDSCGLRRDTAESAAKIFALKTRKHPDEVLGILRGYGFSDLHISLVVRKYPQVLLARKPTLVPKLAFLRSLGVSSSDIGKIVALNPLWLSRSLENFVIPCHDIIKSVLLDDNKVRMAIMRLSSNSFQHVPRSLVKNVSILKELGLTHPMVSYLLIFQSRIVCRKTDKFSKEVRKVIEYGFDPQKWSFKNALSVISYMNGKMWENKEAIYKRWGFSEDAIWLAFKKFPTVMTLSEKKITTTMDFLVNKMGWGIAEVVRVPYILGYSLGKRIVPRCSVIKTLMLKGFLKEKISLSSIVICPDVVFLKLYVVKYQKELPQLLSIFQGKICVAH